MEFHERKVKSEENKKLLELETKVKDFKYDQISKAINKNQLNSVRMNRKFLRILRAQFARLCPGASILSAITYSAYSQTHNDLLSIRKFNNTDVKTFIASKKYCPDIILQYSVRTHKVLRCYKVDCLKKLRDTHSDKDHDLALNPVAPKTSQCMSHAFEKAPVYNFETKKLEHIGWKKETLHMALKTYGFADIGGARRTGKSLIYIWKNNSDSGIKVKSEEKLNLKNSKTKKSEQTASTELLFYQEFKDEILDFMVIGKKLMFWGVATYGIIDIYEMKCLRLSTADHTIMKFRAKLCFEKTFTNVLTRKILPFNERYVMLLPFRD